MIIKVFSVFIVVHFVRCIKKRHITLTLSPVGCTSQTAVDLVKETVPTPVLPLLYSETANPPIHTDFAASKHFFLNQYS